MRSCGIEPDAFDIDRFAQKGGRHRFQYLPFGGGGRICVGAQFATTEALTILAHWLSEWRFAEAGHPAEGGRNGNVAAGGRAASEIGAPNNQHVIRYCE